MSYSPEYPLVYFISYYNPAFDLQVVDIYHTFSPYLEALRQHETKNTTKLSYWQGQFRENDFLFHVFYEVNGKWAVKTYLTFNAAIERRVALQLKGFSPVHLVYSKRR